MDIFVGLEFETRNCGVAVVLSIESSKSVEVKFLDTGYKTLARFDSIRNGNIKDKMRRSVHGFGFIGDGEYKTSNKGKNNDAYLAWQRMIGRCYDPNNIRSKNYADCTVCDEWSNFQTFADWYYKNHPKDGLKYHLDKDIKVPGNRTYGPSTCSFVSAGENSAFSRQKSFTAVSPSGCVIEIINLAKFCRENNLNKSNMHKVLTGKNRSCNGWTRYEQC